MKFMTNHASKRCQQRGIPPEVVDCLFEYGEFHHARAAEICHFSKKSKRLIKARGGRALLRRMEKYLHCYFVYRDGRVVTVGHRLKPLYCH